MKKQKIRPCNTIRYTHGWVRDNVYIYGKNILKSLNPMNPSSDNFLACNTASGNCSFVGNGLTNTAPGKYSSVLNGNSNTASGAYASILGGANNHATGSHSVIIGGSGNTDSGYANVFIAGTGITAVAAGTLHINNLWISPTTYNNYPGVAPGVFPLGTVYVDTSANNTLRIQ